MIAKGAIRLLIGYEKESTIYKVENAYRTIVPELVSLVGRTNVVINGLDQLSPTGRLRVESAVFGRRRDGGDVVDTPSACSGSVKEQEQDAGAKANAILTSEALRKRPHSIANEETTAPAIQIPVTKSVHEEKLAGMSSYSGHSPTWKRKLPRVVGEIEIE